jgi:uncharacterized protein with HEPN domain
MTDQDKKFLSDILHAVELIESFISDTRDFESYLSDLKTQSAIERQLGIIGEAVNKFERAFPGFTIKNARKIVGFRNRLIHTYDAVDPSIVWAIIKNYLTPLKSEVISLLRT